MCEIKFSCSYMGSSFYRVTERGRTFEAEWNRKDANTLSYARSIFNGSEAEFERQTIDSVGFLISHDAQPISDAALTAFHAYLEREWNADIVGIERFWQRDGKMDDPRLTYPLVFPLGAVYWTDDGWKRSDVHELATAEVG